MASWWMKRWTGGLAVVAIVGGMLFSSCTTFVQFPGGLVDATADGVRVEFPGGSVDVSQDGVLVDVPGFELNVSGRDCRCR